MDDLATDLISGFGALALALLVFAIVPVVTAVASVPQDENRSVKTILMPLEASSLTGSVAGIAEIARAVLPRDRD